MPRISAFLVASVLLVFVSLSFGNNSIEKSKNPDYVLTPYGYRLKQCVLEVPHESIVSSEIPGQVIVETPIDNKGGVAKSIVNVPAECSDDIEEIRQRRRSTLPTFPLNGWLDYAGWYPPTGQSHLETFNSTYTIPKNPSTSVSETLFYFIGMQDNDDPSLLNILQPVLTWGNGLPAWYVQSWACCPSNITVSSPQLTGLKQGQTMFGVVERLSVDVWRIDSEWQGQHTTLHARVGSMNYNWADVTLEVYDVDNCQQFANGVFIASALGLYDQQGKRLTPSWQFTSPTVCSGKIMSVSKNAITISHNSQD